MKKHHSMIIKQLEKKIPQGNEIKVEKLYITKAEFLFFVPRIFFFKFFKCIFYGDVFLLIIITYANEFKGIIFNFFNLGSLKPV